MNILETKGKIVEKGTSNLLSFPPKTLHLHCHSTEHFNITWQIASK